MTAPVHHHYWTVWVQRWWWWPPSLACRCGARLRDQDRA